MNDKIATHAEDRGLERLNLSPASVQALQAAADRMWFSGGMSKLTGTKYYSRIRDPKRNLLGYAVYKTVGGDRNKPRLILASILDKSMTPRGGDISNFFNTTIKDNSVAMEPPKPFTGLSPIPNNVG